MVIFKRNLYRNHRRHFAPGDQPPPQTFVSAREYAISSPHATFQSFATPKQTAPSFPFRRGVFAMAPYEAGCYHYPETFILQIPKGRVLQSEGIVITDDNRLLTETASNFHRSVRDHRIFAHDSLPSLSYKPGRVAVIASLHADVYFHWMCNVLPRLELLNRVGIEYDWLYVPALTHPFQIETLRHLQVDLNRILVGGRGLHLQAEQLIVPSLPSYPCDYPPAVADFLRARFQANPSQKRRLYLSRAGAPTRQVLNEAELIEALSAHGFESILLDSLSVTDQAQLFSEAETIFSPHGAALTNLAFCRPGTQLIELFHPDHLCDCYWQASHHLKIHHTAMLAQRAYRNVAKRFNDRNHDMRVAVAELHSVLRNL